MRTGPTPNARTKPDASSRHGTRRSFRPGRRRRRTVAVLVALVGALLAAACTPAPSVRAGAKGPARYVSLGDSWVAGPLITSPVGSPIDCGRSSENWPSLLAVELDVRQFVDVSCGGAKTDHLWEPQSTPLGGVAAPQLDAVTRDTTLITIGIGGNDVGFASTAIKCVNLITIPLGPPPFGRPCVERLTRGGVDRMAREIAETRPKVEKAIRHLRRRAPQAQIFLVGYPVALPHDGVACFPHLPILQPDVTYLRDKFLEMNAMLAKAAERTGVHFVDTYTPSIGHDACKAAGDAWVNSVGMDPNGIPAHPNGIGHRGIAAVVADAIRSVGG